MKSPAHSSLQPQSGDWTISNLVLLLLLTILALAVMGYHPGLEDDAFYLAAIKRDLNPTLFPHDADFFRLQFQATIFDKLIALSVRASHLPLMWVTLLWQFAGIFFVLHACWRIARRCFSESAAQWAAVTMIAVMLTLPVTGTGINLADQYLHPRILATAAILAAIVAVLDRRLWRALILLVIAFLIHALMAAFGISLCAFLLWKKRKAEHDDRRAVPLAATIGIPFGWMFEPASDAWRQAAATRSFYFLAHWQWYEWLGIFAPLVLIYAFHRIQHQRVETRGGAPFLARSWREKWGFSHSVCRSEGSTERSQLAALVTALLYYGIFQTIVGLVIMLVPAFLRLRPFEPMRYLHLIYLFLFLIAGALLGRHVLKRHVYRWLLLFIPLAAGMFYAQRQMYPASRHLELPGRAPHNPWLEAFAWIRSNTPVEALFAVDPRYMTLPGEDYHGFRALAERSVLADYDKDGGMAARVPSLAPRWLKEVNATANWKNFQAVDFVRLKKDFAVTWVIVSKSARGEADSALTCPHENDQLKVCRLY